MLQVLWRFVAKLSRSGYCVVNDDVLPLTVNVQNFSAKVIHMRSKILQKVMMFAHTQAGEASPFEYQRSCYKYLADVCSESWQVIYKWNAINWAIPNLPPTLLGYRTVCVEYILEVSAVIPNALKI